MRRVHLRGHENILKRLVIHAAAFNLGLLMRHRFGSAPYEGCRAAYWRSARRVPPSDHRGRRFTASRSISGGEFPR